MLTAALATCVIIMLAYALYVQKPLKNIRHLEEENERLHTQIGQLKFLLDTQESKNVKLEITVNSLRKEKAVIEKKIQDVSNILRKTINS